MLARLPPPIVYTLRDQPAGSPVAAIDRLFEVLEDGSFQPPAKKLSGPGIIGATARAVEWFDSPTQMWDAMRTMVGAIEPLSNAVSFARAEYRDWAPPASVTGAEHAYAVLGGMLPPEQLAWWEAALRFLLDPPSR